MENQMIKCPYCNREFPISEAMSHQIKESLKKELEDQHLLDLKKLQDQLEAKDEELQKVQKLEIELIKQRQDLEKKERQIELEVARKVDEERVAIRNEAMKVLSEEHRFKDLQKDKVIKDLTDQIEELKRRAEQGSQQMQGEVVELELEDLPRTSFPFDCIKPVPKGIRGADILQEVHNQAGQLCGTIIWETKRTKSWSDDWIPKLKDDQREVRAEIAVLMSAVLPKDLNNFAYIDNVWVTNYASVIGLATSLRINLIQVTLARMASVGKGEKMEALYNYLSGPQFKQRVEAIVEAFNYMNQELEKEKRAMIKI